MSYQAQSVLSTDGEFTCRVTACCTEQAEVFRNDARPSYVALADDVLRGELEATTTFIRICASAPGIADKVDNGDGTITSANVTDADLLSLTQANWPTVADLYFNEDGSPKL